MARRACISSGYMFRYPGEGTSWRRVKDWEVISGKKVCGTLRGKRVIDGAEVLVVSTGRRGRQKYYAALPSHVKKT